MVLIKCFGEDTLKTYIIKEKNIKIILYTYHISKRISIFD